jgi:pyridoxal phosphate enzyme (YggS family)
MQAIAENIKIIRDQMAEAAIRAGRDPAEILLCAATKMNDADAVRAAVAGGVDCCGENRVQELTEKLPQGAYTGKPVHFIGHLQKNKAKLVVGKVDLIQSVDSVELAGLLNRLALEQGIRQNVLLEVNIGAEESKSGISPSEALDFAAKFGEFPGLHLQGLMAIPPKSKDSKEIRHFFAKMYNLFVDIREKKYDNVSMDCLSMGMSGDFADAIAEGSTMIRVGTAIFGPRDYTK